MDCTFIDAPDCDSPPKVEKSVKPSHGSKFTFNKLHTNRTFDILIKENHMNYSRKTEDFKHRSFGHVRLINKNTFGVKYVSNRPRFDTQCAVIKQVQDDNVSNELCQKDPILPIQHMSTSDAGLGSRVVALKREQ